MLSVAVRWPAESRDPSPAREGDMSTSVKSRLFLITSVLCLVTMGGGDYLYARALASRHVYRTVPVTRGSLASAVSATGTLNAVITVQVRLAGFRPGQG